MAFSEAELKTWVGSLGLSEADQAVVVKSFSNPDVLKKVESSILTQSEFSRKLDELKTKESTLEREYQEKVAAEDKFKESLVGWKTAKEKEIEAQVSKAREESEAKLTAARDKIRQLANAHGIPEDEIKDLVPASATPTPRVDPPRDDTSGRWMSKDEFRREAAAYARLPGLMVGLDREYYRLFGNDAPPPSWDKVIEEAERTKKPLATVFSSTYKMDEKRAEISKIAHDKEIEDARKAGAESERSKLMAEHPEYNARTNVDRERSSPVLSIAREQMVKGAPDGAKDPNRGTKSAAAAWNEGKYREGAA